MTTIEILGFDRLGFVDEITTTIDNYGQIKQIKFDADGIKATGHVEILIKNKNGIESLLLRLKAIKGVVKVLTINKNLTIS